MVKKPDGKKHANNSDNFWGQRSRKRLEQASERYAPHQKAALKMGTDVERFFRAFNKLFLEEVSWLDRDSEALQAELETQDPFDKLVALQLRQASIHRSQAVNHLERGITETLRAAELLFEASEHSLLARRRHILDFPWRAKRKRR